MRWLTMFLLSLSCLNGLAIELSISVNDSGETKSCITGNFHGLLIVQQFRWNEWRNVDTIGSHQQWSDTSVAGAVFLHGGENQIRLLAVPTNPYIDTFQSPIAKVTSSTVCNFDGKCYHIGFTVETIWEKRDKTGKVLRSGHSFVVNTNGLPKGGYYLYYDNKRSEFFKQ